MSLAQLDFAGKQLSLNAQLLTGFYRDRFIKVALVAPIIIVTIFKVSISQRDVRQLIQFKRLKLVSKVYSSLCRPSGASAQMFDSLSNDIGVSSHTVNFIGYPF